MPGKMQGTGAQVPPALMTSAPAPVSAISSIAPVISIDTDPVAKPVPKPPAISSFASDAQPVAVPVKNTPPVSLVEEDPEVKITVDDAPVPVASAEHAAFVSDVPSMPLVKTLPASQVSPAVPKTLPAQPAVTSVPPAAAPVSPVAPIVPAPTQRLSYEPVAEKPAPQDPLPDVQIPALRTYKNDISHTVETDKITTAKIMLAEQKQQEKVAAQVPETSVRKPKNVLALLSGIALVVAALGLVGYFGYAKLGPKAPSVMLPQTSFFLFAFDGDEFIDATQNKPEVLSATDAVIEGVRMTAKDNTYTELVFYKTNRDTGQSNRLTANEFFRLHDVQLPTNIARSISSEFAYGLYKNAGVAEPFVVIGLVDYESAYDSMFAWEPTLAIDMREFFPNLMKIFGDNPAVPVEVSGMSTSTVATTTATSTGASAATSTSAAPVTATTTQSATSTTPAYAPINRNVQFVDVVLSNRDTRALRDQNGAPYFYYAFIDRDKILFAQDPKLIPEIIRKIREKQLIR